MLATLGWLVLLCLGWVSMEGCFAEQNQTTLWGSE